MSHLARAAAQDKLRLQECFVVAQSSDTAKIAEWINHHRALAGF